MCSFNVPLRVEGHGASLPLRLVLLDEVDSGLFQVCMQTGGTEEPLIPRVGGGGGGVRGLRKGCVGVTLGSDDLISIPPAKLIC